MKLNPVFLKRPSRPALRYAFTDESNPGQEWVMWLRRLDPLEEQAAGQSAEEHVRKYITGGWVDEGRGYVKDPCPLSAVDGEPLVLSEKAFHLACRMEAAQSPQDGEEKYTAIEILSLAPCLPEAWDQFRAAFYLIQGGEDPKGVWTAFMEQPSDSDSNTESDTSP